MKNEGIPERFGAAEQLQLHQLRLLEWLASENLRQREEAAAAERAVPALTDLSAPWRLTPGLELMEWQKQCREAWFAAGCRGTVKVVTGAGKTILALAIAERLQNEHCRELRVAVVVPTIVLMNQWYEHLVTRTNLPDWAVGRLGGGFQNEFDERCRFLISVLDSAQRFLPEMVRRAAVHDKLLLIADECHRAGAPVMSRVLSTPRAYSLGLSATPERDDSEDGEEAPTEFDFSLLGKELGPLIYELSLAQALEMGIVPPYTIKHYGLSLSAAERAEYERLSRIITETREELQSCAPGGPSRHAGFFRWVQRAAQKPSGEISGTAARFLSATLERKELLYRAEARFRAVARLLEEEFSANPETMAILFHENIDSVNQLYLRLKERGLPVVLEHSKLPQQLREASLDLFRKGIARVIVSARSLIEGFNVPAVDVGIIAASSTSVRQRIQSMGRVLRRHRTRSGEEKAPVIHILYVRDTVDELIYEREDWGRLTGAERNLYYRWDLDGEPVLEPGPPRACRPEDDAVDVSGLKPGDPYPGRLEGEAFSCDSQGNIRDQRGRYLANPAELYAAVRRVLGRPGRFYVTPRKYHCLVQVPAGDQWEIRYVTTLAEPPQFLPENSAPVSEHELLDWLRSAQPGDPYPFQPQAPLQEYKFSQKMGGVIAKKVPRGEVFALTGDRASDPVKGEDAVRLLAALRAVRGRGDVISRFSLDARMIAIYRKEGQWRFLAALKKGLEFPENS